MNWKIKAGVVGIAWIVVPWTWAIALEQQRRQRARREDRASDGAASED
jgi:hypothetical protein